VLGEATLLFRDNANRISSFGNVLKTLTACEIVKYQTGLILEAYIDAELRDGNGVSWLLSVDWTDTAWVLKGKLVKSDINGQESLKELSPRTIEQFEDFLLNLIPFSKELLAFQAPELTGVPPIEKKSILLN
jgi:hypothetical protein